MCEKYHKRPVRSCVYTVSKVNRSMNRMGENRQGSVWVSYRPAGFMLVAVEVLCVLKCVR